MVKTDENQRGDNVEYIIQFQLNIFSLFILGVIYATLKIRSGIMSFSKLLLEVVILLSIIGIILEPLTWIFDGAVFDGAYFLEYSTNFLVILIAPLMGGFMMSYVDYYLFRDRDRIVKKLIYFYPTLVMLILLIINMFFPIFFSVDPLDNSYHGADLSWIQNVVLALMYLYMFYFLLKNRKKTFSYIVNIFIFFMMLPLIGVAVQTFSSRLYFSWTAMALAVLVIYIYMETTTGERDYLTKLYSRQSYEKYIYQLIEIKKPFEILLIDLDNFKIVNDQFGHLVGDQVLVEFANILVEVLYPNKIVSRLAGDEFMAVIENEINIEKVIKLIYEKLGESEETYLRDLRFSYGCQRFHEGMTTDELYTKVDDIMYKNKRSEQTKILQNKGKRE